MFADKLIAALHKGDTSFDLVASGNQPWSRPNVLPHELFSGSGTEPGEANPELDLNILDLLTKQYPAGDPVFRSATPVKCQFFDFGEVLWDLQDPEQIAESEASMEGFALGLLKLPFPICFFSWLEPNQSSLSGFFQKTSKNYKYVCKNEPMGLLAFQPNAERSKFDTEENKPFVTVMFGKTTIKNLLLENNHLLSVPPKGGDFYCLPATAMVLGEQEGDNLANREILYSRYVLDNIYSRAQEKTAQGYTEFQITCTLFLVTLLGRLNADGMAKETVYPPEKVNRKRQKRGQPEKVKYTTVRVAPYRMPLGRSGPRENDFTPVRYHLRRGHVRRFKNGNSTWVNHCMVGDPTSGAVEHDYVVNGG